MTDKSLVPPSGPPTPSHRVEDNVEGRADKTATIHDRPTTGVLREEGTPRGAATLGLASANNPGLSVSNDASNAWKTSHNSMAWIESAAGDTSGIGAVMLRRLDGSDDGKLIDPAAIAAAANDNVEWVTDLRGIGAIGCLPTVADLATGDTLIAWIGADGHVHGRLYPPMHVDGAPDGTRHAGVNAALDDLGPVGVAPEGPRRLQVAELRPGTFAVMWLALAQGGPVLRGSVFIGPADDDDHGYDDWVQHAIPDVNLPQSFPGPFSIALATPEAEERLEVTCSGPAGTVAFTVLDRDSASGVGGTMQPAAAGPTVGPSAAGVAGRTASAPAAPDENAAADLDALPNERRQADQQDAGQEKKSAGTVLTVAAAPGVDETAPLVATVGDGFAVAWQEPGATDQTRQIKVVLYDAYGGPRGPEILVADNAAAGAEAAAIAALRDGLVAAYVEADDGALMVKVYAADGAQIGHEMVVARGGEEAIVETALAANAGDEFAVVWQQYDGAGGGTAEYGNIMLQRYGIATVDGAASLVELGRDGERDGIDDAAQVTIARDDPFALELAVGRSPAAIGLSNGGLAVAWVEPDGAREAIHGVVLDQHGVEVHRIDFSHLLGEAGIAEGTEPTLLDVGGGGFLVSWLQPDGNGGYAAMAALYRETAPGTWLVPDTAMPLKAFSGTPDDYVVSVSSGAEGHVIIVIWSDGGGGSDGHRTVYSQRYDLEGRELGEATKIAEGDAAIGAGQHERSSLAAADLANGHIVVSVTQGSAGDQDLFAHLVVPSAVGIDSSGNSDATGTGRSYTILTRVGEETAIDPLENALGAGLSISHINGVPITETSPVDVGFGWVQLRQDGWLTVAPDVGYRGRIAFDYSVAGMPDSQDSTGRIVVDVGAETAPAAVTLLNQVTAVAEDVSTQAALKVADIAMTDGELETDGLSLTGLDAGMFEIVGNALYLKQGIELDFESKPTLSVEIRAGHVHGHDDDASFTLNVAGAGAAALAAANDMLLFAPGYADTPTDHPLTDLSAARYGTFLELLDAGVLTQEGDNVVITLNLDDPADLQKIILKGAALSALGDADFKFS